MEALTHPETPSFGTVPGITEKLDLLLCEFLTNDQSGYSTIYVLISLSPELRNLAYLKKWMAATGS